MPTMSMFYNNQEHDPPYFHITYNAVFNMDKETPKKQLRLISSWTELCKDKLLAN